MKTIETSSLINKTNEELREILLIKTLDFNVILKLNKTEITKNKAINAQKIIATSSKQAFRMYTNYKRCLEKENPYIKIIDIFINNKNEILLYGIYGDGSLDFVITKDQISKRKNIELYPKKQKNNKDAKR